MSGGFVKLFGSIITSTIWQEDPETKVVWITLLVLADAEGFVNTTIPGLANIANISIEKTREAIEKLESSDSDSRTTDFGGRRIAKVDGGWLILNYLKYRKARDPLERKEYMRKYMQEYRKQNVNNVNKQNVNNVNNVNDVNNVNHGKPKLAQAEAEAEEDLRKKRRNSEDFRLASLLFSEIRKRKPDFRKPDLQSWAKHVERMIRIDRRKPDRIEAIIKWAQNDSGGNDGKWKGWQNNILSTRTLREKFDRLELSMGESSCSGSDTAQLVRNAEGKTPREQLLGEIEEATAHG